MNLSPPEAAQFLALYRAVLLYANRRLQILPGPATDAALDKRPLEDTTRVRDALYDRRTGTTLTQLENTLHRARWRE
jgi:hypothetical protein